MRTYHVLDAFLDVLCDLEDSLLLSSHGDFVLLDGDRRDVDLDVGKLSPELVGVLSVAEDGVVNFRHGQHFVSLKTGSHTLKHSLSNF